MTTDDNGIKQKLCFKFYCEKCDYGTSKKSSFDNHSESKRHKNINLTTDDNKNYAKLCFKKYTCESCEKPFNDRAGLWRHKKKCKIEICNSPENINEKSSNKDEIADKELIMMLIKDNAEFKNMMMKVIENGTMNHSHNTTNSHNKSFNLQFFLNETCKDAMNIMDFVDSIKLQLSDLEGVGELGYVEGISKIIVKNLKELDVTQRPVHCTDKKRETMYIKDEDKWEKDEERLKLHKVVRKVACKNQNLIPKFKELHPDCGKYHSKFSDQYNKIVVESMGGPGDNDFEKEEKIIKNISKQVFIDKEETI